MAEIYVKSSSDLESIIQQLTELNSQFRSKAEEINSEKTALTSKWEGDASTAFAEHFDKEYPNFETFATAIDEYVTGLTQILEQYNQAEDSNVTIAQN